MTTFELGAVLALKSGSQDLTCVAIIEGGKGYNVAWHDAKGVPHTEYYPAAALELASVQRERQRREAERENAAARRAVDAAGEGVAWRYFG